MSNQDTKNRTNVDVNAANAKAEAASANAVSEAQKAIAARLAKSSKRAKLTKTECKALRVMALGGEVRFDTSDSTDVRRVEVHPDGTEISFGAAGEVGLGYLRPKFGRFGIVSKVQGDIETWSIPELNHRNLAVTAILKSGLL